MFKISATLIIAAIAGSTLASNAEAHGTGQFLTSYVYRMQGRHQQHDYIQRQREIAYAEECERQRQIAAARAKAAAAERARLLAMKQAQAKAKLAAAATVDAKDDAPAPVAKKGDLQPIAATDGTTVTKTASAAPTTCRKYSPTTASMIETACE